jgi:hypothetical protein
VCNIFLTCNENSGMKSVDWSVIFGNTVVVDRVPLSVRTGYTAARPARNRRAAFSPTCQPIGYRMASCLVAPKLGRTVASRI